MSPTSIVTVLDGHPDSLDATRWAAWLSQETRLPLCVVHAFTHQSPPPARRHARRETAGNERRREAGCGPPSTPAPLFPTNFGWSWPKVTS